MRSTIALSSLVFGLAIAGPVKRQELDLDDYEVVATAVSAAAAPVGDVVPQTTEAYNPTSVAGAIVAQVTEASPSSITDSAKIVTIAKRAAVCTTRVANGPQVSIPSDTPEAFQANPEFSEKAKAAAEAENVPAGYASVPDFVDLKATAKNPSYLTYVSSKLVGYNPAQCAELCDNMKGCNAFNIYYERVPSVVSSTTQVPDPDVCPAYANSASATLIKCAFYGMPIIASEAKNIGQFQGKLKVVYAGSNGYVKSGAPSIDGFEGPVAFGNATINAPAPVIDHGYFFAQTLNTTLPFDPELCAAACIAQTAYNAKHHTFNSQPCVFFNAYILYKNKANGVFRCAYYGIGYDATFATNDGQWNDQGDHWTIDSSYGYYIDYSAAKTKGQKA